MSLAGAVRWMLSSRIFTSMVSVGTPGMANSTTSLWFSPSAYATVLGATLIRSSGIVAPSFHNILFRNFHFDIRDAHSIHPGPTLRPVTIPPDRVRLPREPRRQHQKSIAANAGSMTRGEQLYQEDLE